MSANRFAVTARSVKEFVRPVGQWWAIMAGALSIPFAFLALFNVFSRGFLFAALAYLSLWVLVIAQYRRTSALAQFKLAVLPSHRTKSDDPNSVFINLSLSNDSTPPSEVHNIAGEFWTDQRFVLSASAEPTNYIHAKVGPAVFAYYNFSLPMLHKNTNIPITEWKFRTPSEGEFIPIGIRVVSSETQWRVENWRVVCDGKHVHITLQ